MLSPKNAKSAKSESIYHKMIEEVEDYAILLLNKAGDVVNWNKGAEKIKGYRTNEIVGRNFRLFYTKEDIANHKPDMLLKQAEAVGKASDEGWRVRKDGSIFWGSIVITALHDDEGRVIGFTKVTRDLTERKQAEDQLRQYTKQLEHQNKELEQFAYIASHDLQEPLRTISAFVELLKKNYQEQLDGNALQYMGYVVDASNRMHSLIKGLLDFSRIGRIRQLEKIDSQQLVAEVIDDLQAAIQEAQAHIQVEPLPVVTGYRIELKLLFQNLVSNALKFRKKEVPAQIGIRAKSRDNGWEFAVSDNGIGIDPKFFNKIFIIFQRLNSRQEYPGTGIGLAHCNKIVQLHEGEIWLTSQPGSGSVFYFFLPHKPI
jgi:PAS domain S-box-containing protein